MWRISENSDSVKPLEIDEISSNSVVYVRRNFEEITQKDMDGNEIGTAWRYEENAIQKKDWETYKELLDNQQSIIETNQMLTDLELENIELRNKVDGIGGV